MSEGDNSSRRAFLRRLGYGIAGLSGLNILSGCSTSAAKSSTPDGNSQNRDTTDASVSGDNDISTDSASDGGSGLADSSDASSCRKTGSDVEGPFFIEGAPERQKLAPDSEPGQRLVIEGTIYKPDCQTPVPNAMMDIWHANAEGDYYDGNENYRLRGQMKTDENGYYRFETIKPGNYPLGGEVRPAHIHYAVTAPDLDPLTTQLYFASDPNLAPDDPCNSCSSDDETLIIELETSRSGGDLMKGRFDIVLG